MSLFRSKRERLIWSWTFIIVVTIFSTLSLANSLVQEFGDTKIGEGIFVFCCLLFLALIATQGFQSRPRGIEVVVILGIVTVYMLVFARMSIPTERSHLIEYGVVALFIYEALLERKSQGGTVSLPAFYAIIITSVIGVIDEVTQKFLPDRVFDTMDIVFNIFAAIMAISSSVLIKRVRSSRDQKQKP